MKFIKYLIGLFKHWTSSNILSFNRTDDIPEVCKKKVIDIIGKEKSWLLTFLCPCGCSKIIMLNLLQEEKPNWSYSINKKRISIYPSVNRVTGCKSHFWIKNGQVLWC